MQDFPTWLPVVALALRDAGGRLLLQQRRPGKPHAGAWEFPGGKVERGEALREALVREIAEELALELAPEDLAAALFAETGADVGADVGAGGAAGAGGGAGGGAPIVLFLYTCSRWLGEPQGLEGQAWGWFAREEAAALDLAPADRDLLRRLG